MTPAVLEDHSLESEQREPEMAVTAAVLEERVDNHIKAFKWLMLVVIAWLAAISVELYHMNGTMNRVEKAQANAPAQIVARLLSRPAASKEEAMDALLAASTILNSSKSGPVRPDAAVLKQTAAEIMKSQDSYPELPAVWQATSAFINYRSSALLPSSSRTSQARGVRCIMELGRNGMIFRNCELSLETISDHYKDISVNGAPAVFNFINCIVHYSGGSIPAKELYFSGSILEFRVHTVPDPVGVVAMRQLMASDPDAHLSL
jgi:hypothetical protein